MATRGRKPTPTAIKELEGNPGKRPLNQNEPKPKKTVPSCPKWLDKEAKKEWRRLAAKMEQMGVLSEVDMAAFAGYCQCYARWKENEEFISKNWVAQGYVQATPGNVIDYAYIQNTIGELSYKYHIWEIAFDRWGSNMLVERLTEMGLTVVPFGQGYKDMSPASRAFYEELMKGNIIHGGNPVMKWMCGNVVIEQDPAGNIKPTKAKSKDKIDGVVAAIMALDRCIRHENEESVYDSRGLLWI